MKKITFALLISLFSLSAWSTTFVTCDSVTGSNRTLSLAIKDARLFLVNVQTAGSHARAFAATAITTDGDTSFYALSGSPAILEVQNSVLQLEGGLLNIGEEKFVCEAR